MSYLDKLSESEQALIHEIQKDYLLSVRPTTYKDLDLNVKHLVVQLVELLKEKDKASLIVEQVKKLVNS